MFAYIKHVKNFTIKLIIPLKSIIIFIIEKRMRTGTFSSSLFSMDLKLFIFIRFSASHAHSNSLTYIQGDQLNIKLKWGFLEKGPTHLHNIFWDLYSDFLSWSLGALHPLCKGNRGFMFFFSNNQLQADRTVFSDWVDHVQSFFFFFFFFTFNSPIALSNVNNKGILFYYSGKILFVFSRPKKSQRYDSKINKCYC